MRVQGHEYPDVVFHLAVVPHEHGVAVLPQGVEQFMVLDVAQAGADRAHPGELDLG
jgi:hypothetical protein